MHQAESSSVRVVPITGFSYYPLYKTVSGEESCLAQSHGPSLVSHTQRLMDEGIGLFQPNLGQL